jgi:hypothetical protein
VGVGGAGVGGVGLGGVAVGGLVPAPEILTVAVLGVPSVAFPDARDRSTLKVFVPANGLESAIGTAIVLFEVSPSFQLNVPLLTVYSAPAPALPFEVA